MLAPWKESYDKSRQHIRNQRHYLADKGSYSQSYGFSSCHIQIWELNPKDGWVLENWCFWTVVLEKTLESPLDSKEIKQVNPKGNEHWIFTVVVCFCSWISNVLVILCDELTHWKMILEYPDTGRDWGKSKREFQRMRWFNSITNSININLSNSGR